MEADGEEWKVVMPKGRKGRRNLASVLAQEAITCASVPVTTSVLDVASVAADHEGLCKRWRTSSSYEAMCSVISDNAATHTSVETAICLGVGSFDLKPNDVSLGKLQQDAHIQLEAFRAIVGILGQ